MKRPALARRLFVLILCLLIFTLTIAPNVVHAAAGKVKEFPTPTANSAPVVITIGLDGNLWFTEGLGNQIGRITLKGKVSEFGIPTANSQPHSGHHDRFGWQPLVHRVQCQQDRSHHHALMEADLQLFNSHSAVLARSWSGRLSNGRGR